MNELVMDVITSVVAVFVGFGLGQIVAWRKAVVGGREFLVPTAHPGPRSSRIAAALIIVVAVASMATGVVTQYRVEECNQVFRQALSVRSEAAGDVFEKITTLQVKLAQADPGPAGDDNRYQARKDFVQEMKALTEYRKMHPIPDVECG